MAQLDKDQHSRHVRPGREAIVPFVVGVLVVIAGTAIGLVAAAMVGSLGTRPAVAAPTDSIDPTAATVRVCRDFTPDPEAVVHLAARQLPVVGDSSAGLGFVEFDSGPTDDGSMPGFGPLQASACAPSGKSLGG